MTEAFQTRLHACLCSPWADKLLAAAALLPLLTVPGLQLLQGSYDGTEIEMLLLWAELAVVAVTMATRRSPNRVLLQPAVVALVLLTVYWPVLFASAYDTGRPLVPRAASLGLALAGFCLAMWARWALGRNIGLLPAQRELVALGPYAWLRHPIYAALMLGIAGSALADFSARNALLDATWVLLLMLKSVAEERFLASSPAFAAHFACVPDRWLPLQALRHGRIRMNENSRVPDPSVPSRESRLRDSERSIFRVPFLNPSAAQTPRSLGGRTEVPFR